MLLVYVEESTARILITFPLFGKYLWAHVYYADRFNVTKAKIWSNDDDNDDTGNMYDAINDYVCLYMKWIKLQQLLCRHCSSILFNVIKINPMTAIRSDLHVLSLLRADNFIFNGMNQSEKKRETIWQNYPEAFHLSVYIYCETKHPVCARRINQCNNVSSTYLH